MKTIGYFRSKLMFSSFCKDAELYVSFDAYGKCYIVAVTSEYAKEHKELLHGFYKVCNLPKDSTFPSHCTLRKLIANIVNTLCNEFNEKRKDS